MLVCLLPARNCADDLPGYFESAARFADAVVALDDGSTDATRELLECSPLVQVLLENRRRAGYRGWDDSANRNRLLAAAADLDPDWIISLDADERIDPTDAAALGEFVATDAVRGDAYLFKVFRMIEDLGHYDQAHLWVGRLFAYEHGQVFPAERLHFVPLPTSIPRQRWRKTTFRIQHLSGLTESRRRATYEKYREADADRQLQGDYSHILQRPGRLEPWWPRSPHVPVYPNARNSRSQRTGGHPTLSAVLSSKDCAGVERAVASVSDQSSAEPFEVIVVTSDVDTTAKRLAERLPHVRLVELEASASLAEARNAGLAAARGEFVTYPAPDVELRPDNLAARIRAHRLGYAMVSGTPLNQTLTLTGWASYFLDHSAVLPHSPSQEHTAPPAECSYLRPALLEVGGFREDRQLALDTIVNTELFDRGYGAYHASDALYAYHSQCRTPAALLRQHFGRGRVVGELLLDKVRAPIRFAARRIVGYVTLGVPRRLRQVTRNVWSYGGSTRRWYAAAFPLVVAALLSEWLGACFEIARHGRATYRRLS